jgi:hypothetical protein
MLLKFIFKYRSLSFNNSAISQYKKIRDYKPNKNKWHLMFVVLSESYEYSWNAADLTLSNI